MTHGDRQSKISMKMVCKVLLVYFSLLTVSLKFVTCDSSKEEKLDLGFSRVCPKGWLGIGKSCLKSFSEQKLTWHDARKYCSLYGGDLVSVENDFVNKKMDSILKPNVEYWLGSSDHQQEGTFRMVNGKLQSFSAWSYNEPNDSWKNEDCVIAVKGGKWNDGKCDLKFNFVCEKEAPQVKLTCPDNSWTLINNKCLKMTTGMTSWHDANTACKKEHGGELVHIKNQVQNEVVQNLCTVPHEIGCWIGVSNLFDYDYTYSDNTALSYTNWAKPVPPTFTYYEDCVHIAQDGKWIRTKCSDKHTSICQVNAKANQLTCPDQTWTIVENKCVKVAKDHGPMPWKDARKTCQTENTKGDLVVIENPFQRDVIKNLLETKYNRYWIGLRKQTDGTFRFTNGKQIEDFSDWASNQPDKHTSSNVCVEIEINSNSQWKDVSCAQKSYPICQMDALTVELTCPDGSWVAAEGVCIKTIENRGRVSYSDAKRFCEADNNGYLAQISSSEQNHAVTSLLNKRYHYWVGISEMISNRKWSDLHYTNWDSHEPNGLGGHEDCVEYRLELYNGGKMKWNDMVCNYQNYFVCQSNAQPFREKTTTPQTTTPQTTTTINTTQSTTTEATTTPSTTTKRTTEPATCPTLTCPTVADPYVPQLDTNLTCPDLVSWTRSMNTCFRAFAGKSSQKTWLSARKVCQEFSGDLIEINNAGTNNIIKSLLISGHSYWTGISDVDDAGIFQYVNGSSLTSFQPWVNKGVSMRSGNGDDCVAMVADTGKWEVLYCGIPRNFVCQTDASDYDITKTFTTLKQTKVASTAIPTKTTPRKVGPCPGKDWLIVENVCVKAITKNDTTWQEARDVCKNQFKGDLFEILSTKANDDILQLLSSGKSYWIGIHTLPEEEDGTFVYVSGKPVSENISLWAPGQPSYSDHTSDCVLIDYTGKWDDKACNVQNSDFLCQTPVRNQ